MQLDHVTIRTRDIAGAREFFRAVFDVREGERPLALRRIPGCWLYASDKPLIRLIASHRIGLDASAEAIDLVGLRVDGYAGFRERLDRLGIRYSLLDVARTGERGVLLRTPGGPRLEAVFDDDLPLQSGAVST